MSYQYMNFDKEQSQGGRSLIRAVKCALALGLLATGANLAQAQTSQTPTTPSEKQAVAAAQDEGLTWHGITLYGIVDLGYQFDTHSAPFSDYHPAGSSNIVQKYSRQSANGFTPSNESQSRIGLQGAEPLGVGDLKGVFRVETFFNPQSGQISDALKSEVQNNGKSTAQAGTNLDSSVAGEAFEIAYAGFSSKQFGALTFGRQNVLTSEGVAKYDPNYASQAFSLIGMSGTYAGAGDTEDRRVDNMLKYSLNVMDIGRFGAFWKFNNSNGSSNTMWQVDVGGDYAGASVDAYFGKTKGAISASPLSAAQITTLGAAYGSTYSPTTALSGTISDNTVGSLMGLYTFGPVKIFAAYEYVQYDNPAHPIAAGFQDIGGYVLAVTNNTAYPHPKIMNVYWGGVRYTAMPGLDLVAAYYGVHQNSYGTGTNAHCDTNVAGTCTGTLEAISFDADYAFTKRFDVYTGAMWSQVNNGIANGYTFQRNNINPTIGVRFKF